MALAAGRLDRRIRLERDTGAVDPASGERVAVWATLGPEKLWASRRRAGSSETLAAAELSAAVSDVFEIRWDSTWADVNPKDRLVFEGRVYQIVSVDEIGRREGLRIGAVARADQ